MPTCKRPNPFAPMRGSKDFLSDSESILNARCINGAAFLPKPKLIVVPSSERTSEASHKFSKIVGRFRSHWKPPVMAFAIIQ